MNKACLAKNITFFKENIAIARTDQKTTTQIFFGLSAASSQRRLGSKNSGLRYTAEHKGSQVYRGVIAAASSRWFLSCVFVLGIVCSSGCVAEGQPAAPEVVIKKKKKAKESRADKLARYADTLEGTLRALHQEMQDLLRYEDRVLDELSALAHDGDSRAQALHDAQLDDLCAHVVTLRELSEKRSKDITHSFCE